MPAINRYYFGLLEYIKRFFDAEEAIAVQIESLNPTHYVAIRDNDGNRHRYEVAIQEFYDARNSVRLYAGYCKALNTLYYSFNAGH